MRALIQRVTHAQVDVDGRTVGSIGTGLLILLGVGMTLFTSRLLSKTLLRGIPSSFALELPPYRRPQIGKVIVRSVFDRTLFVLGREIMPRAAPPPGLPPPVRCFGFLPM